MKTSALNRYFSASILLLPVFSVVAAPPLPGGFKAPRPYLGVEVGTHESNFKDTMTVSNGAPYPAPYNLDQYSVGGGHDMSFSFSAGAKWQREEKWFSGVAFGLRYQHFLAEHIDGTITQYSLPQFQNYTYTWDVSADVLSLSSRVDLTQWGAFTPYFDVGLGVSLNHAENFSETALANVTPRISPAFGDNTKTHFAYNLGVGVDYAFRPELALSVGYDYQYLGRLQSGNGVSTWSQDVLDLGTYKANLFMIGLTYYFDGQR